MTINVLRRRGAARAAPPPAEGIMITDDQPDVPSCPACGRPLESVMGRCPGCGTRLVLGVQAKRAGVFTAFGMVVGLLGGAAAMGIVMTATKPAETLGGAPQEPGGAAQEPGGAAQGQAPGSASGVVAPVSTPMIPSASRSALSQAAVINDRIDRTFSQLRAQLADKQFDQAAVSESLRALAANARVGATLVPQLQKWPTANQLSAALGSFYGSIRSTAREGLAASLTNAKAYKVAAKRMVAVLASLPAIDTLTQGLGEQAGLTVPGATQP